MTKSGYLAPAVLLGWLIFTGPPVPASSVLVATRYAKQSPRSELMGSWKDGKAESLGKTSSDRDMLPEEAREEQDREEKKTRSEKKDK